MDDFVFLIRGEEAVISLPSDNAYGVSPQE
jgi:hypothetical protein